MANGKIRFGKQSGGQLALVIPDGVDNTEVIVPESGILATKQYVDDADYLQPSLTANATLTGIDNKIVMNGIVTSLGLEIGDVIQFTSVANANNQKLRTVESIINNNEIIVNYEHCGSRGNGALKLTDETLTNATIKRIAKWYNSPLGLGQDIVDLTSLRVKSVSYTSPKNRTITVSVTRSQVEGIGGVLKGTILIVNGIFITQSSAFGDGIPTAQLFSTVSSLSVYYAETTEAGFAAWVEMR